MQAANLAYKSQQEQYDRKHYSREEWLELTCGKAIGRKEWLDSYNGHRVLVEQNAGLVELFDKVGQVKRGLLLQKYSSLFERNEFDILSDPTVLDISALFEKLAREKEERRAKMTEAAFHDKNIEYFVRAEEAERDGRLYEANHFKALSEELEDEYAQTPEEVARVDRKAHAYCDAVVRLAEMLSDDDVHLSTVARQARELKKSTVWKDIEWKKGRPYECLNDIKTAVHSFIQDCIAIPYASAPSGADEWVREGLVTGLVETVIQNRDIRVLPLAAKRKRRDMLNALTYYLEHKAKKDKNGRHYCRYLVITEGVRTPFGSATPEKVKKFIRKISKWAAESNKLGVEVVFRGIEMPVNEFGYHIHANLLVEPKGYLKDDGWSKYLQKLNDFFGTILKDNGRIEDPNELVKYVFKPEDVQEFIVNHSDNLNRMEELFKLCWRTRLVAPMGNFREFFNRINDDKLKVLVAGNGKAVTVPKFSVERFDIKEKVEHNKGENIIASQSMPNYAFTRYAEPSIMRRKDWEGADAQTHAGQVRYQAYLQMQADALAAWYGNEAPDPQTAINEAYALKNSLNITEARKVVALRKSVKSVFDNLGTEQCDVSFSPSSVAQLQGGGVLSNIIFTNGLNCPNESPIENQIFIEKRTLKVPDPPPRRFGVENGLKYDLETGEIFE